MRLSALAVAAAGCTGPAPAGAPRALGWADDSAAAWPDAVEVGPVQPCPDPLPAPAWDEVGAALGLPAGPDPDAYHDSGGGMVVSDFDGDGALDVLLTWESEPPQVAWGGERSFRVEALPLIPAARQPSLVDIDQDGDLDVLFGTGSPGIHALLAGPSGLELKRVGATGRGPGEVREFEPGDLDGDGVDELFVAFIGDPGDPSSIADRVGRLTTDGTLQLDTALDVSAAGRLAFDALWFDHEGDGDLDVYVVNDKGQEFGGDALWRNDGGALVDASAGSGADIELAGMGGDAADLDGDGREDLLVVGTERAAALLAQPDGTYADAAEAWGWSLAGGAHSMAWGVIALDYDNDGDQDVLVAHGDQWGPGVEVDVIQELPLELYEQRGGALAPVGAALGLARVGSWRSVVAVHLDDDGVLDLLAADVVGRPQVYRSIGCTAAGWLAVQAPPGSRVVVEAGGEAWVDTARTGSSYGAAGPPVVHVGLGGRDTVDRVTVTAPGAAPVVLDGPLAARRRLVFTRP